VNTFYHWLATFFFLGHIPVASGTWGTAGALVLVLGLAQLVPASAPWLWLVITVGLALVLLVVGVPAGTWSEKEYGRKDPSQCVLDEVVGYLLAVAWISPPGWPAAVVAFFVFRAADVFKVYPANKLEKLPGGYGIMLDDVVAGLYSLLVMIGVRLLWTG
jgi:phosphatidylglycerophosphatase A